MQASDVPQAVPPIESRAARPTARQQLLPRTWSARVALFLVVWLAILRVGAHAGPSDLAKVVLGLPSHPPAVEDLFVLLAWDAFKL